MKPLLNILRSLILGLIFSAAAGGTSAQQVTSLNATRGSVADLVAGGSIRSTPAGTYTMLVQTDGNLVIYNSSCVGNPGCAVWASGAAGGGSYFLSMQNDGNLVMYRGTPANRGAAQAVWNSGVTAGVGAYFAALSDDANLVVYRGSGFGDNRGAFWSRLGGYVAPDNDSFGGRRNLGSTTSGTSFASTSGATLEAGEPQPVLPVNSTGWWQWTAPANGTVTFDTLASDFDTVLTAWTGTSLEGLINPAVNDNADGTTLQSKLTWGATAGTTYQIRVGALFSQGSVNLNWVFKQTQSIDFPGLPNRLLGLSPTFSVAATSSSGLPVNFASPTPSVCAVIGTLVTIAGPGTCTLTASQAGNGSFDAATVSRSFLVAASFASDRIATGGSHTCAVVAAGTVKCWGLNAGGQLGSGNFNSSNQPVAVNGLGSVLSVSAGWNHTCALTNAGTVKCWGYGLLGQLGNGSSNSDKNLPVDTIGLSGVVAIAAGGNHTCALTHAGTVKCWGAGSHGQLGNGALGDQNVPVDVSGLSGVVALAAGGYHTCALNSNGTLKCWGLNQYGQLGDGSNTDTTVPISVSELSGLVAVSAGASDHTCALSGTGTVKCWGNGVFGELGNGAFNSVTNLPVDVVGLSGVAAIAAGGNHNCALLSTGRLKCWGHGGLGELGNGNTSNQNLPVDVTGLNSVTATAAGGGHTCALTNSGIAFCWGDGASGQLGDGVTYTSNAPSSSLPGDVRNLLVPASAQNITFAMLSTVSQVAAPITLNASASSGLAVTFASLTPAVCSVSGNSLTALTTGRCSVAADQFGNDTFAVAPQVMQSLFVSSPLALGQDHTCAGTATRGLQCWGSHYNGQLGIGGALFSSAPVTAPSSVNSLSFDRSKPPVAGTAHTCALTSAGGVSCWGENSSGQLGVGSSIPAGSTTPLPPTTITTNVASLAAGDQHTCAVRTSGALYCWGANASGQLGTGNVGTAYAPTLVTGLDSGIVAVVAGEAHTCSLDTAGGVQCWGLAGTGGTGSGANALTPVPVPGLSSGVISLAAGFNHTCALLDDASVKCWGANNHGQIGNGTTTYAPSPVTLSGLSNDTIALAAGKSHTCALSSSGVVWCWGANDFGQIASASLTSVLTPAAVANLGGTAVAIGAGGHHSCAELVGGALKCWGENASGQLGDGTTADSPTPVVVGSGLNLLVPPNFLFFARTVAVSITQGSVATYTIDLIPIDGFAGQTTFSVSGLPAGTTASFQPNVIAGSGSTSLTVATTTGTPAGTYLLTIGGVSGSLAHSFPISLIVLPLPEPDFLLSATPSSVSVAQGSSNTSVVSVSTLNGYSASTTLSISGLPAGATATFAPTSVTGAGSSTLTVATAAGTPAGSYTVTVTGTSGSLVHTTALTLVVTAGTGGQPDGDVPLPAWALWLLGAALLAPLRRAGRRA